MQLIVVENPRESQAASLLEKMFRLRAQVFAGRLRWQVDAEGGIERDRFDSLSPTYLILLAPSGEVVGCVRLLPPSQGSMLIDVFPKLLSRPLSTHQRMIESSRFCVDHTCPKAAPRKRQLGQGAAIAGDGTRILLAGIVEWSLLRGYDELVTVTDLRFERLLRLMGWPFKRLGENRLINETQSIAGSLSLTASVFDHLKPENYPGLIFLSGAACGGEPS